MRVVEVQPGSPAQAGGLVPGDVIVALDEDVVTGIDDIARILDGSPHRQARRRPHPARRAAGDDRHRPDGAAGVRQRGDPPAKPAGPICLRLCPLSACCGRTQTFDSVDFDPNLTNS